jgi:predicted nucleic acid-binding protein
VKFLLDVNALLAWGHPDAADHVALHAWLRAHAADTLCSCAITELGFLRVSMQVFRYNAVQAQRELHELRKKLEFLPDLPAPKLPAWCKTHGRTTDAYLLQIAAYHGAQLATFDTGIPGAVDIAR